MQPSQFIQCTEFPCPDARHENYLVPDVEVKPEDISIVLISEASPLNPGDYYYAPGEALFQQTTVQAFNDAGAQVTSIQDILKLGIYLTTAVKCGKTGYAIKSETIATCSHLLEAELALFPNVKVILLMGDVAIKALNNIARRAGQTRVIPAGSTYKIRASEYYYQGKRVFPSYLQAGPSFFIEKSKRRMIAEDLSNALRLVN
jgi:uracil-DNA glycosylase